MYSLPPRFAVLAPTLRVGVSSGRSASLPHHASRYSLPRSAWACRRDAPRPCRRSDARHRGGGLCSSRRPSLAPTLRVGVSSGRSASLPPKRCTAPVGGLCSSRRPSLAPTLRVGVSSGRSASLPPGRCAQPAVHSVPAHDRAVARRRASGLHSRAERGSELGDGAWESSASLPPKRCTAPGGGPLRPAGVGGV